MGTKVEIVSYDASWPLEFEKIRQDLQLLLPGKSLDIEHIGSTAVVGLSAKPCIDVDIILGDLTEMDFCRAALEDAGYEPRGSRYGDGVWAFLRRGALPHQRLSVCPPDSLTHTRRVLFRDRLRENSDLALQYQRLKLQLVQRYEYDGDAYTRAKTDFINTIIDAAVRDL
jgi:GrpB-like predicted nucleotidyltransferase (UPF0157 family)